MTNEEFTGHLLASLHGPKAAELAARVGVLLCQDGALADATLDARLEGIEDAHPATAQIVRALFCSQRPSPKPDRS